MGDSMAVRRPFAACRASLSSERGSLLVEVMVGAIVLAIVTFAVLDGMSGAADTGERNRQRSVASTLAQQDIERLRAFEITDLSNYRETRNVNMAASATRSSRGRTGSATRAASSAAPTTTPGPST
jgi:type II secretory pathway pseudopilin PulG